MGSIYIARARHAEALRRDQGDEARAARHGASWSTRFFEEARTVNSLKHPNIVESIDLVEDVIDGAY